MAKHPTTRSCLVPAAIILAAGTAGPALAQSATVAKTLFSFNGDSADDVFGRSVSGAGDVNGDGFDDYIVGAPYDDNNGSNSGSARVFSGADGGVLFTFNGESAEDFFGRSVSGAGDVNGDGFADLIVGASNDDNNGTNSGSARVFSGATGGVLFNFNGDSAFDFFGSSVSGAGDVNGDGFDDLIVGSPGDNSSAGNARVFSGADGTVIYTFFGDLFTSPAGDLFGYSVSGVGDLNGDGFDDLIVGAPGDDRYGVTDRGTATVFSGRTGSVLFTSDLGGIFRYVFTGDGAFDRFGTSVSGACDVNGDGFDDFIVGAPGDDNNGSSSGSARVFSGAVGAGATGSVLFTFNGDSAYDDFGDKVSGAGDVNGDGFADLIVGAYGDDNTGGYNAGSARVFSGSDGGLLANVNGGSESAYFGSSVSGAGDVNGDGLDDLIVGAFSDDTNGTGSGSARVFTVQTLTFQGLYTFNGDAPNDRFGISVSGAGDVTGDGFDDFIVGAWLADNNGINDGSARVFSGADGSVVFTFNGDSAGDSFGFSVSGAGDVNGDGFDDFIVGARNAGSNSGSARVFSGADGSVVFTFNGDSAGDYFGESVSDAGDVNGDGFDDVIVGAAMDDNNGTNSGSARVFSGADGNVLFTFNGDSADDRFGRSVSGAGDVNGDGFDDLIVGARFDDNSGTNTGSARVFSGDDGSVLFTFNGDSAFESFGSSVSGAGDVNGDGFDDLIVGARFDDNNGSNSGSARVFSGADGTVLYAFNGDSAGDYFGGSVSGAGDVNGDGFADIIVGASGNVYVGDRSGSARVFSGADGSVLATLNGDGVRDGFGDSVSGAGDVNGDGLADLIVGAPFDDNNGTDSGSARVFSACVVIPPARLCADQNGDGLVLPNDFSAWIANFNALNLFADVNQDGLVLPNDFSAWVAAFNLGASGPTCTP